MSQWHTPTTFYHSIYSDTTDYQMNAMSIQQNDLLHIGLVNWLKPSKITIPWQKNSSPLPWPLRSSTPCFLVQNCSCIIIININHLPNLAASTQGFVCGRVLAHHVLSPWQEKFYIHIQQNRGMELAMKAAKFPGWYFNQLFDGEIIVCHSLPNKDSFTQWKITLTKE